MRHLARWVLALCLGAAPAAAQGRPSAVTVQRELDGFIRRGMADWGIPGLSVAVVRNDSVLLAKGYGVRRLGEAGAVDERTLFGMMSTTKAMTAVAVAMLVDDGRLAWSDPVTKWIPEFALSDPYVTRQITVLDLLTHNTGLGNTDLLWTRGDLSEGEVFRRLKDVPLSYSLRGGFVYQNVMYGLAGEVIARASGMPFSEFLTRRVFQPLGLSRTYPSYRAAAAADDPDISTAHYRIDGSIRPIPETDVDLIPAAGAVWSSARDMAAWLRFLLDGGRVNGVRLVSDSSFRMLFAPHAVIGPDEFYPTAALTHPHWTTYGLGWFEQDYQGRFLAFHTGSLDGRTAIVGLLPDERSGVYVFGNLDHAEFRHALMLKSLDLLTGAPARDWSTDLRQLYGGLEARADSARRALQASRIAGTHPTRPLAEFAGHYRHPVWGDLEVTAEGDSLGIHMGTSPQLAGPLTHWHYDTFSVTWGDGRDGSELVTFDLGTNGRVRGLWFGSQRETEYERQR
jgi:CubicO group peptidase (beta-lactamase class C family)